MAGNFRSLAFTPAVLRAQVQAYGREQVAPPPGAPDQLGAEESAFIASRDSFYLSSVSETGWPYVQHRGGPAGFLQVLDASTIAFGDFNGNRQMLTVGNASQDTRVALILMDYARRERLKLLGHLRVLIPAENPALAARLQALTPRTPVERLMVIEVVAHDWNCPKFITPRYTATEIEELTAPLRARIAELENQLGIHS